MENRKFIKFLIPIFVLGFFIIINSNSAFAYEIETHAYLTNEIIKFYNQNFSNQRISDELKNYLIDGSRREDDTPRWMNHYYDPVYNRGLSYDRSIDPLINLGTWQKSKDWAQDANNQNSLTYKVPTVIASILSAIQQKNISILTTETDFTWQKAIRFYVNGEKEKAIFLLGHILHLIEDKAVPDHTRNDAHPGDSPYEKHTEKFVLNNPDKNLSDRLKNKTPSVLNDLNSYFDELAKYSNNNFYSKDTIGIQSGYKIPEPIEYERIDGIFFSLGKDASGFYKLSVQPIESSILINIEGELTIDDNRVLQDYWSRLSTKSVQYGAGVINLFFQEVEKAKNDPNFVKTEEKSFIGQAVDGVQSFFVSVGGYVSGVFGDNQGFQSTGETNLDQNSNQINQNQIQNNQPISQSLIKQCSFNTSQSPSRQKFIINEVAWMGSANSADDEWIELKNISSNEANLNGYQLVDQAEQIKIIFDSGDKISFNGFYLLERSDDNSATGVSADKIYSGALANTNEGLRLFDGNCNLVDEVLANPNWSAGNNETKKTAERSNDFNWHTSSAVGGTPRKENSQPIVEQQKIQQQVQEEADNEVALLQQIPQESNLPVGQATFKQCVFGTTQSPSHQGILINEVAWMGGSDIFGLTAADEWIELKNISNNEINLSGWQLIDKAEQIKITFESANKISAGGFYLLERTDDGSIPNVPADLIYSNTLNNSDEGLRLFDNQCNLIDEVLANSNWPAGDNDQKRTMERNYVPDLSWHTYNGIAQNSIFGTPKKENSAPSAATAGGSGGGTSTNNQQSTTDNSQHAKILINEIQAYPTDSRFIELYNPNDFSVDLTDWYLQRKTQTGDNFGSLVSKTYFEGKIIGANSYFLISRDALENTDIVLSGLTLTESNAIQLKNSNGEIIDKIGWGQASDCENNCAPEPLNSQSIQRKFQDNIFIDTDNNFNDFEIQTCPSPKAQSKNCSTANQAPGAFFVYAPQSPVVNEEIAFNAASSTDDGQIISYQWDFGDNASSIISTATTTHSYFQAGDYQASLIVFDDQNASSTPTSTIISIGSGDANRLVIDEIMAGTADNADNEFIELYNQTDNVINLSNWSLKRKTSQTATSTENLVLSFSATSTIAGKSFFLTAHNDYIGTSTPDFYYTNNSNPLAYGDDVVILYNNNGGIVDEVAYQDIPVGQSLERMALVDGQCATASNSGEFLGNGCDTNNPDDFEIRQTPNPQNSLSFPEPRISPTAPQNFEIQYSSSTSELIFNWQSSQDYLGAASTLIYKIIDISLASSTLSTIETASTTATAVISEFDRNYKFSLQAFDKDGLGSEAVSTEIDVPQPTPSIVSQLIKEFSTNGMPSNTFQGLGKLSGALTKIKLSAGTFPPNWYDSGTWFFRECDDIACRDLIAGRKELEYDTNIILSPDKYYFIFFYQNWRIDGANYDAYPYGSISSLGGSADVSPLVDYYFELTGVQNVY